MEDLLKRKLASDLIIFDLDGTLIESSRDIAWAVNKTLKYLGFNELSYDAIKSYIGWGVKMLLEQAVPKERHNLLNEAREIFLRYYEGHLVVDTYLYEGARDVITYFKHKKLAVVTNKPFLLTKKILKEFAISDFFKKVVGGDTVPNKKPHPQAIDTILNELDVRPEKAVFVGDSSVDITAGRNAGVITCGAVYGFRGRDELINAGADLLIEDIRQLKDLLSI